MQKYNIAVVGATGAVGEVMLNILETRGFPVDKIFPLASSSSVGKSIVYVDKEVKVAALATFDFSQVDIAMFSAGSEVSKQYAPIAATAGAIVIDNTSAFRYDEDIPLIVPEVNSDILGKYKQRNIIANPNCSTIQMLVALAPIHTQVGIDRINVATYQAVSGSGKIAIEELMKQTTKLLSGRSLDKSNMQAYPKQIGFNVLPHIDVFQDNSYTKEEMKMVWETQKILADKTIKVNPTCVRVPVFYGHSEAVHIETKEKASIEQVIGWLEKAKGVKLVNDVANLNYPTAIDTSGKDAVYVGRLRADISHPLGINMWVVADNIRKGAALNSIQIAEELITQKFI